ncbi:hypothetical protein AX17_005069 [Amanita inopinata Kibby_2008]|nr:hypothetical protein AX17_005069 [Amanita inopinata Kibby_2008]
MFNRRRSLNPPSNRPSTASMADLPPSPSLPPPVPPVPHPDTARPVPKSPPSQPRSQSSSPSPPRPKTDPWQQYYQRHLKQQSNRLSSGSGKTKYPPPVENKPQIRRARTASNLLGPKLSDGIRRVSSLFSTSSSLANASSKHIGDDSLIEVDEGGDNESTYCQSVSGTPKKGFSLIKSKSKVKRIPPILTSPPPTPRSVSNPVTPSKLARFAKFSRSQQRILNPVELPDWPATPRSHDSVDDIRRPSGLGRPISAGSLPPSPYTSRFPWREGKRGSEKDGVSEKQNGDGKKETSSEKEEDQGANGEGKGTLKGSFRFPNKSVIGSFGIDEGGSPADSVNDVSLVTVPSGGRLRAVSSPNLALSMGAKMKEKLERERELERVRLFGMKAAIERRESAPLLKPREEVENNTAVESEEVGEQEDEPGQLPERRGELELGTEGERQRITSFSLVHMFPEPPTMKLPLPPSAASAHRRVPTTPPMSEPVPVQDQPVAVGQAPTPATDSKSSLENTTVSDDRTRRQSQTLSVFSVPVSLTGTPPHAHIHIHLPPSPSPRHSLTSPFPPSPLSLYTPLAAASLPSTATITVHSTSSTLFHAAPLHLPHEILTLAVSFLPSKRDIAPLARVSKSYAAAVRTVLYDTFELCTHTTLDADPDVVDREERRVRRQLGVMVRKKELATLVKRFVCHDWPEWFPSSPYQPEIHEQRPLSAWEQQEEEEEELQNTFLSATLALVFSRMTNLVEVVLPSFHPFLLSCIYGGWGSGLKSVEFRNVTMTDDEAEEMFQWLNEMTSVEKVTFPTLVEKGQKASSESLSTHASNDSLSTSVLRMSSRKRRSNMVGHNCILAGANSCPNCCNGCNDSNGGGGYNASSGKRGSCTGSTIFVTSVSSPVPLCFPACCGCHGLLNGVEVPQPQQHEPGQREEQKEKQEPALAKYVHLRTFLPNLRVLQATPAIVSSLAASSMGDQERQEAKPWRPLREVTINVDTTLYTGLRPSALACELQGLHLKRLGLRFGERVDRRTVERLLLAVGAALGNDKLKELDVEFVGAWVAETDETLYKIVDAALPRYRGLRRLKLRYSGSDMSSSHSLLTPAEETRVCQWVKHCEQLEMVGLLSGSLWTTTTTTTTTKRRTSTLV